VPAAPANPALAIDAELVRVILPRASDDRAGEDAMTKLEPPGALRPVREAGSFCSHRFAVCQHRFGRTRRAYARAVESA